MVIKWCSWEHHFFVQLLLKGGSRAWRLTRGGFAPPNPYDDLGFPRGKTGLARQAPTLTWASSMFDLHIRTFVLYYICKDKSRTLTKGVFPVILAFGAIKKQRK